jgi:arsenate reductase
VRSAHPAADEAREACPVFPGASQQLHGRLEDPAAADGTEEQRLAVYRRVRDQIEQEIRRFVDATAP